MSALEKPLTLLLNDVAFKRRIPTFPSVTTAMHGICPREAS